MCGRYVPPDIAEIERFWHIGRHNWHFPLKRTFNAAPTTAVPIVVLGEDGVFELCSARWGLIPSWWKKDVPPHLTFNARSEEAAVKPMWRQSLRTHRCLMPARGWYEWKASEQVRDKSGRSVKQPYFISCPNAEVIAFAAMWATWASPDAESIVSCALLTKAAAPDIAAIHDRMPAVLAPDQFAQWLDPATKPESLAELMARAREDFEGYAVGTEVNNAHNDYPELLQRVTVGQ